MKKAYNEIKKIVEQTDDSATPHMNMTMHLSKLAEEFGELAQAVNKLNGRKKRKSGETRLGIISNIEEEAVDSIQCIMAIAINAGIKYEFLQERLHQKNQAFAKHFNIKLS